MFARIKHFVFLCIGFLINVCKYNAKVRMDIVLGAKK